MRIGINGYYLQNLQSGIGQYSYNIIQGLSRLDKKNEYFIFVQEKAAALEEKLALRPNFKVIATALKSSPKNNYLYRLFWEQWTLGRVVNRYKIDVYHSLYQSMPWRLRAKSMVTIHDAIPWFFEFQQQDFLYRLYSQISRRSCSRANKIIAVSEAAKFDIVRIYKIKPEFIEIIHEPANALYSTVPSAAEIRQTKKKFTLKRPYILFTGGLKRHKNLRILIKSFARLITQYEADVDLVIVGSRKRKTTSNSSIFYSLRSLEKYAASKKIADRVHFTGTVTVEDLNHLYHAASITVSLSLYEGFGLPLLEAMTAGCPVIASDIAAHQEVAGNATILVNPFGYNAVSEKMNLLLTDEKFRQEYITRGLERAKNFNAIDIAARIRDIYSELYNDRNIYVTKK